MAFSAYLFSCWISPAGSKRACDGRARSVIALVASDGDVRLARSRFVLDEGAIQSAILLSLFPGGRARFLGHLVPLGHLFRRQDGLQLSAEVLPNPACLLGLG